MAGNKTPLSNRCVCDSGTDMYVHVYAHLALPMALDFPDQGNFVFQWHLIKNNKGSSNTVCTYSKTVPTSWLWNYSSYSFSPQEKINIKEIYGTNPTNQLTITTTSARNWEKNNIAIFRFYALQKEKENVLILKELLLDDLGLFGVVLHR